MPGVWLLGIAVCAFVANRSGFVGNREPLEGPDASRIVTIRNLYNVEIRILLDEAGEVAELGDGRRRDRVNRRVVERNVAVSGAAAVDPEVRPGPGPNFGIADFLRRAVSIVFMSNS